MATNSADSRPRQAEAPGQRWQRAERSADDDRSADDLHHRRDRRPRPGVFVSNAGIGSGEPDGHDRRTSADGYELRFAVNYLAAFLLTMRLLPLLQESAPARVINVACLGQHPLDFDDLMLTHGYSGVHA